MWKVLLIISAFSLASAMPPAKDGDCQTNEMPRQCIRDNSKRECNMDIHCPGVHKCCPAGCGTQCVCPQIRCQPCEFGFRMAHGCPSCLCKPNPCEAKKCGDGEHCELEEVQCGGDDGDTCAKKPKCVKTLVHPGTCPTIIPKYPCTEEALSKDGCTDDSHCDGLLKCCDWACGKECVTPVFPPEPTDLVCPRPSGDAVGICADTCVPGSCTNKGELCCHNSCGGTSCQIGCERVLCKMACEQGFKLDENGCETCECLPNHCDSVKCGYGEVCVLQTVNCVTAPCPPLAVCLDTNGEKPEEGRPEETDIPMEEGP